MSIKETLARITPEATINEIISADKQAAKLLESIGLSVTEHENETLQSVCQQRQWSEVEVLKWVKKHSSATNEERSEDGIKSTPDTESSLQEWTVYLEETFIRPNQNLLEELDQSFPRVQRVHGNQYPWLKNMRWDFNEFEEALQMYYEFELKKFFPLIGRLSDSKPSSINNGAVQKIEKSFTVVQKDQKRLQQLMKTIREKGKQFENPGNACSTLRIQNKNFITLFAKLNEQFEIEQEHLVPHLKKELKAKK